jgi:hypothetical protein
LAVDLRSAASRTPLPSRRVRSSGPRALAGGAVRRRERPEAPTAARPQPAFIPAGAPRLGRQRGTGRPRAGLSTCTRCAAVHPCAHRLQGSAARRGLPLAPPRPHWRPSRWGWRGQLLPGRARPDDRAAALAERSHGDPGTPVAIKGSVGRPGKPDGAPLRAAPSCTRRSRSIEGDRTTVPARCEARPARAGRSRIAAVACDDVSAGTPAEGPCWTN